MALEGKVAVVPVGDATQAESLAHRLAAAGMTVVLVGDGPVPGALATHIESAGCGRPAVFAGDDLDELIEFLTELFRSPDPARG